MCGLQNFDRFCMALYVFIYKCFYCFRDRTHCYYYILYLVVAKVAIVSIRTELTVRYPYHFSQQREYINGHLVRLAIYQYIVLGRSLVMPSSLHTEKCYCYRCYY